MKSEASDAAHPIQGAHALGRFSVGVLVVAILYSMAMLLALQVDRPAHSGKTFLEQVAVEVYDWLIYPTVILSTMGIPSTNIGLGLSVFAAGLLCGVILMILIFSAKCLWSRLPHKRTVVRVANPPKPDVRRG